MKIEVGDIVQYNKEEPYIVAQVTGEGYAREHLGSSYDQSYAINMLKIVEKGSTNKPKNPHEKEEIKMKKCISDVYEKTAEAVLVEKYGDSLGIYTDNLLVKCIIKSNKAAFLAEAKRLEAESK